jgi:amidase
MDMSEPDLDLYNSKMGDAVFNFPFNLAGLPAMSVPTHMSAAGLPIGVQLVGRFADEATVLQAGAELERHYDWSARRAPISA